MAEDGILGGDGEVAEHGQVAAARQAVAAHHGDGGFGDVPEVLVHLADAAGGGDGVAHGPVVGTLWEAGVIAAADDVIAGGKGFIGAGEDDGENGGVGVGLIEGGEDVVEELVIEGIALIGPVEGDAGELPAQDFVGDGLVRHGLASCQMAP